MGLKGLDSLIDVVVNVTGLDKDLVAVDDGPADLLRKRLDELAKGPELAFVRAESSGEGIKSKGEIRERRGVILRLELGNAVLKGGNRLLKVGDTGAGDIRGGNLEDLKEAIDDLAGVGSTVSFDLLPVVDEVGEVLSDL